MRARAGITGAALVLACAPAGPRADASGASDCVRLVAAALADARRHLDQNAVSRPAGRPPNETRTYFFEFEVTRPAERLAGGETTVPDSTASPAQREPTLVQFVVDRAGRVEPAAVLVLRRAPEDSRDSSAIAAAVTAWRYRPAEVTGCPVAQLVQAPAS